MFAALDYYPRDSGFNENALGAHENRGRLAPSSFMARSQYYALLEETVVQLIFRGPLYLAFNMMPFTQ